MVLLASAHQTAKKVYTHVKRKCAELHDATYLPKAGTERAAYDQLYSLRGKSRARKLSAADYQLLARMPHILGPTVFGAVEKCDGGWRWTFAPAGLQQHSELFESEAEASQDLAAIQQQLHPAWHDRTLRAAHLQRVVQWRAAAAAAPSSGARPSARLRPPAPR